MEDVLPMYHLHIFFTGQVSMSCLALKWYTCKYTKLQYLIPFHQVSVKICFIKRKYSHCTKSAVHYMIVYILDFFLYQIQKLLLVMMLFFLQFSVFHKESAIASKLFLVNLSRARLIYNFQKYLQLSYHGSPFTTSSASTSILSSFTTHKLSSFHQLRTLWFVSTETKIKLPLISSRRSECGLTEYVA